MQPRGKTCFSVTRMKGRVKVWSMKKQKQTPLTQIQNTPPKYKFKPQDDDTQRENPTTHSDVTTRLGHHQGQG